jgi:hypothetical protein
MMPPSTTPAVGEARAHADGHGYGLVLFASILRQRAGKQPPVQRRGTCSRAGQTGG